MVASVISDQSKRGWQLELNGEVVPDVSHMRLSNPRFGSLEYGDVGGYDSWNFQEPGGGGSVILPYFIGAGYLFVLMVEQSRPNQGGKVWNAPRGFLEPGESHFGTAVRELEEETGIRSINLVQLGDALNPNSAFFVTSNEGEGVRFFGLQVEENEVKTSSGHFDEESLLKGEFVFDPAKLKPVSKTAELIFGGKFVRYEKALAVGDMFTVAGVGRLAYAWLNNLL